MRNNIIIRSLQLSDAEQWRRLRLEALRSCPTAFSSSYDDAHRQDLSSFAAHIPPPEGPSILLGAFDGETLSGSVGLHVPANPKLAHRGEIWAVYVAPALRGTGVAAAMMRAAIAHARTRVSLLHLSVGTDNDAARELYRTLGFVSYGIERRSIRVDGVDHDSDLLVLTLDA
jgi:ribosomal protein S18 acetylase RimI-like enzyme